MYLPYMATSSIENMGQLKLKLTIGFYVNQTLLFWFIINFMLYYNIFIYVI